MRGRRRAIRARAAIMSMGRGRPGDFGDTLALGSKRGCELDGHDGFMVALLDYYPGSIDR
ncbi:MAG: hypothetical protein ACREUL_01415 [Steroidobacteraceae bacterium]